MPRSLLLLLLVLISLAQTVFAQPAKPAGPPRPQDIGLETKDGVMLRCTYYEGTAGKKSVPIIAIHDWDGQRGDFDRLPDL